MEGATLSTTGIAERVAVLATAEPYERALSAVRGYAAGLLDSGHAREEVYGAFERARGVLEARGAPEEAGDVVLDVMDFLAGFGAPHVKLDREGPAEVPRRTEGVVVVDAPVDKIYDYWHTLENLPRFMSNIEEVRPVGPGQTHWVVKGPLGVKMEFDAQTTQDEPNRLLAWNTVDGDNVETSGQVRFQELGPDRTRLEVTMNYGSLPGGRLGEVGSKLVANPQVMLDQDLQNFKQIMEGTATEEEIQQRPSAATAQSGALAGVVAFLTSGVGLAVVGGLLLLLLLRRRRTDG